MNTRTLIENEHEIEYDVVAIDEELVAAFNKAFDDYGIPPDKYSFTLTETIPWSKDHKPQPIVRGRWSTYRGKQQVGVEIEAVNKTSWDGKGSWSYRIEFQNVHENGATTTKECHTTDSVKWMTSAIFDSYAFCP